MMLDEIIRARIPAALLERVVYDQGLVDESERIALFKATGLAPAEIARRICIAYGDEAYWLAKGLYDQIHATDWETAQLLLSHYPAQMHHNHQASLVGRIPTLPMEELSDFLKAVKAQVCLIVARRSPGDPAVRGTGFLVGPDLVLTCFHVLKSFLIPRPSATIAAGSVEVYFDFHVGEPVENLGLDILRARKVGLADQWVVTHCADIVPDGRPDPLNDDDEVKLIGNALDFVLLQLDQPVGRQPLSRGGGRRRGWIELAPDTVPQALKEQDWIIIPQHPYGFPQQIDLGRFKTMDQTGTRIRYNTNTAKGTSGAPCFNQKFELVGIHNAYVGPEARPLFNQAIRFDRIAAVLRPHITALTNAGPCARRWSISRDNEAPQVVLGRDRLLDWLVVSATSKTTRLAERVYAAQAEHAEAGCTFSIDILHAELRDSKVPRAVYGKRGQQLPATPEDFLRSLLRELGIDPTVVEPMPERPSGDPERARLGQGETDKLDRWLSEDLSSWLGRVITGQVEHQLDLVEAQKACELEPQYRLRTAQDTDPSISVRQVLWDVAYVVIDELRTSSYQANGSRTELGGEVRRLIAALVKGKPEEAMDPGLRRLRWMFLGYLPDFIPADEMDGNGATLEVLEPCTDLQKLKQQIIDVFERMSQTHIPNLDVSSPLAPVLAKQIAETPGIASVLARLQTKLNEVTTDLLGERH